MRCEYNRLGSWPQWPRGIRHVWCSSARTLGLLVRIPRDAWMYENVSKSFRTGCLERELRMVQLSATRCSCIAILWVSLVEFCHHNPLCCFSTSVYCCKRYISLSIQYGNFWIHPIMFALWCPVEVETLRWADTPSKVSYLTISKDS
jgi:hypothetical protein